MSENIPIIVLSDDDDDNEGDSLMVLNDSSLLIVENETKHTELFKQIEEVDEDLAITYTQTATVLPHARYDCTLPFCRAEHDVSGPVEDNEKHCDQCFCYICDKLASMCEFWTIPGICHCNAHKHSVYWKALRDKCMMGFLHELNLIFDTGEMDSDLRRAEILLQKFAGSLAMTYATFLLGYENPNNLQNCQCGCHRKYNSAQNKSVGCKGCSGHHFKMLEYDYSGVSQHLLMFLNEAQKENPKTCVVMLLGAMKLFVTHTAPGNIHAANIVSETVSVLLWRFMTKVWVLLVDFNFPSTFIKQLDSFFQKLPLPARCTLPKSLSVLPWDDPLLSAVMKGQNVSGERQHKGRKVTILCEHLAVIKARVHKLEQQKRFRELARYLKVVRSINNPTLQRMRDLVPYYLCRVGDYNGAVQTMLSQMLGASCSASRLTPPQFRAYLRILTSGHAPEIRGSELDQRSGQMVVLDPLMNSKWTPIEGADSFRMTEILKFALRVLDCNLTVFEDTESWAYLLRIVSSSYITPDGQIVGAVFAEPDANFQMVTRNAASAILDELTSTFRIQIPKTFENGYPEQARLLLTVQAMAKRIFNSQFNPILPVIKSFRLNHWALSWFFESLLERFNLLDYLLWSLLEELLSKNLPQRILSEEDNVSVAYFLSMFFLESRLVLHSESNPISYLLADWNESYYPWQHNLRLHLEYNVARLSGEKRKILQCIQKRSESTWQTS